MATTTRPAPRAFSYYGAAARPTGASRFETYSWYFFRWSGVILLVLVLVHLVLMHIATDVSATTYNFVAARYANPFWRVYDLVLLTLGLLHGLNGLRLIVDDYVPGNFLRLASQSVIAVTVVTFWLMGTMTIITFQPNHTLAQSLLGLLGR